MRRWPGGIASACSGPLAVAIWLVTPMIRAGSFMGKRITFSSAFGSKTVSASTPHTYRNRARLSAAFQESAFPPFSLSTTTRFGWRALR